MTNKNDEVEEFIKRRFPVSCKWLDGNCYYFAKILQIRFTSGVIWYDVIYGHFVFQYNNNFYDWTGKIDKPNRMVEWDKFDEYDSSNKKIIIRDCIL